MAQGGRRHGGGPVRTVQRLAMPPIGLPLPQIGLPLPPIGLPPLSSGFGPIIPFHDGEYPGSAFAAARAYRNEFRGPIVASPFFPTPFIVYVPQYIPVLVTESVTPAAREKDYRRRLTGSLLVDVHPNDVQVFVDGYYAGNPQDSRGLFALEPGPHNVEIIAPGYETVSFNVKIMADESITYRRVLTPANSAPTNSTPAPGAQQKASPAADKPVAKTFYLIPGCYLGDVPPKDARLPATCDVSRAVVYQP